MKATKGNKVYTIDETQQKRYQDDGFDIYDDDGDLIANATGKTITYEKHRQLLQAAVETAVDPDGLKAENDQLKVDLAAALQQVKDLQAVAGKSAGKAAK